MALNISPNTGVQIQTTSCHGFEQIQLSASQANHIGGAGCHQSTEESPRGTDAAHGRFFWHFFQPLADGECKMVTASSLRMKRSSKTVPVLGLGVIFSLGCWSSAVSSSTGLFGGP